MQKIPLLLGISTIALSLNACKSIMDPTFMPSGYTYHHDEYKSPPAGNPWGIGYDYTRESNKAMLDQWRAVASDLTDKLESTASLGASPIFLSSPILDNAFTISLDHALREELRARGYTLSSLPTNESLKIQTSTYDPAYKDVMRSYDLNDQIENDLPAPPKAVSKSLMLKVEGLIDGAQTTLVDAPYDLPLYGYQDEQLYFPLTQKIAEVWR